MPQPAGLLEAMKNEVDFTWDDPQAEVKLAGQIERGIFYLDGVAGTPQDYSQQNNARALLIEYVRYVRAGALDEFQTNYQHELLGLQMRAEVPDDHEETPDA